MATPGQWQAVFAAWGLGAIEAAERTASGTINETTRVTVASGDYFLRAYRRPELAPGEHAVIAHVRARGVPAVAPLPLAGGRTWLDREGVRYALFPQAAGRQLARQELDARAIAAMGEALARVHHALRDYPRHAARRRPIRLDRDAALAGIARLEAAIRQRPGDDPLDPIALRRLATRRDWLERQPPPTGADEQLPQEQIVHGDYQDTNLFFDSTGVTAIIDWDNHYVASRAWEVARVLDLVCSFAAGPCRSFLGGYREALPLDAGALDRAMASYGLMRAYDLWLYNEYYLEGNARVGQFIHPGDFVPHAARWAAVRPALDE